MENCKHISRFRPKWNQSLLNPQKWMCYVCGTTESVWACLLCPVVACGRFTEEHALKHFQESKHPLSIEVNNKYVYCYECDDYVLNDNASGDLKLLRSTLMAITTQSFGDVETRGKRLLRSYSYSAVSSSSKDNEEDKLATAKCHYSKQLLGKVFTAWRTVIQEEKIRKQQNTPRKIKVLSSSPPSPFLKKRTLIPGVTGLRNLGNTCYMNSVLQVLSHLEPFRDFFIELESSTYSRLATPERTPVSSPFSTSLPSISSTPPLLKRLSSRLVKVSPSPSISTPVSSSSSSMPIGLLSSATPSSQSIRSSTPRSTRYLSRQTTVECFQHLMTPIKSGSTTKVKGGLNGGSTESTPPRRQLIHNVESKNSNSKISLCQELNGLFRVLWSGRWAQVSPHAFLQSVWQMIPTFKGHAQHDAQEFLCELLDKVKTELEKLDGNNPNGQSFLKDIINSMFEGELVSQVTCLECKNVSERTEPFLDLSLEFPDRYQITNKNSRIAEDMCHVTEMLAKFTDEESLEGKIYQCDKCNSRRNDKKGSTTKTTIYTEAKKRLLVKKLPHVLRLHLKRFRWSGRLHREKINTHVAFNDVIDMKPFCDLTSLDEYGYEYKLHSVIMHHGKGFGCGHYTAFCWNKEAGSWVHCNDSRMLLCQWEEVVMSQAYILFYVKQDTNFNMNSISDLAQPFKEEKNISLNSHHDVSITDDETFYTPESSLKMSLSQIVDNEITFNFKTPELLSQTSRKRTSTDTLDLSKRVLKRRRSTFW